MIINPFRYIAEVHDSNRTSGQTHLPKIIKKTIFLDSFHVMTEDFDKETCAWFFKFIALFNFNDDSEH